MRAAPFLLVFLAAAASAQQPRFSFAVFADIQYGDQPTAGKREYRKSLPKLTAAVDALNARKDLAFAIQLGDLIDARAADLDTILPVYRRLGTTTRHVLGNHDFSMPREALVRALGMPAAYYDFTAGGWRFLVVDGMDLSIAPGSRAEGTPEHELARRMLEPLRAAKAANAMDWNGGAGRTQLEWLRDRLRRAAAAGERVIVFCHFPVLRESSTPAHLLWNHQEVRDLLESEPAVAAWFNGHDHAGGYAPHNSIHYVTFPALVESGDAPSYSVVHVYDDRLEIEGTGTAPKRSLALRSR